MRTFLFYTHLLTGSICGLVILFLAVTGCLLTYERQIVALQESTLRSSDRSIGALPSIASLADRAAQVEGERPDAVTLSSASHAPVIFELPQKRFLFFDRTTGSFLGHGAEGARRFFETTRSLHRYFGASGDNKKTARAVKGAFNLALLLMIVTGLLLWLPHRWTRIRLRQGLLLRRSLQGKAWHWNRHNVVGFWIALPLTLLVLTGVFMSYEWATNLLYRATGSTVAVKAKEAKPAKVKKPVHAGTMEHPLVSLDLLLDQAASQSTGWRSLSADLPGVDNTLQKITVDRGNGSRPDLKSELTFDRLTGRLVAEHTFASNPPAARIKAFMHPVHTGEAFGILGQTISGLTSAGCCMLVFTGLRLVLYRFRSVRLARWASPVREN